MVKYINQMSGLLNDIREFNRILRAYNRRNELSRLIAWAARKRLDRPLHLYQNHRADEERRILRYKVNSPRLTTYAYLLHLLHRLITRPPRYPAKGSAAGYRYGSAARAPR